MYLAVVRKAQKDAQREQHQKNANKIGNPMRRAFEKFNQVDVDGNSDELERKVSHIEIDMNNIKAPPINIPKEKEVRIDLGQPSDSDIDKSPNDDSGRSKDKYEKSKTRMDTLHPNSSAFRKNADLQNSYDAKTAQLGGAGLSKFSRNYPLGETASQSKVSANTKSKGLIGGLRSKFSKKKEEEEESRIESIFDWK